MTISDAGAIDLLTAMVRTPSLCSEEDEVAHLLLEAMADMGFETRRDEVGNVIGAIGPARQPRDSSQRRDASPRVVVLGHMDTVPGIFPVEQRDGALYGRGAVDAKGPLATAVVAAARASARTGARVTVIGAVQEEGPSSGARHLTACSSPDFLVIAEPSGWDAVVLGYKGSQRFTIELSQPWGHTAGPEPTAPERMIGFWNDLVTWCARRRGSALCLPSAGETSTRSRSSTGKNDGFDQLTPTLIGMTSGSDGLRDTASLHVALRLPPGLSSETVRREVQTLMPEATFQFAAGEEAVRAGKSGPLVAGFLRSIRAEGGKPRFKVKTGTSDMNVVGPVWGCPMVAYGPGDSRLDHTPHEHVQIDEYLRAIRVLTHVLEEL
jgi:LysW-gamma-L-lysine carboxypeptidase